MVAPVITIEGRLIALGPLRHDLLLRRKLLVRCKLSLHPKRPLRRSLSRNSNLRRLLHGLTGPKRRQQRHLQRLQSRKRIRHRLQLLKPELLP